MIAVASAMFDPDVEEALLRVYGIDPHRATLRRVGVLVRRLPPGSWHKDAGLGSWTTEAYLLANVIDALNRLTYVQVQKSSKRKVKEPKPTWRPGQARKQKVSWAEFGKALGASEGVRVHES